MVADVVEGTATAAVPVNTRELNRIEAEYAGSPNDTWDEASASVDVYRDRLHGPSPCSACLANPGTTDDHFELTATFPSAGEVPPPTGEARFFSSAEDISGSDETITGGVATWDLPFNPGIHEARVEYEGDGRYEPATGGPLEVLAADAAAPVITTAPVDVTVNEGQPASFTVAATAWPPPEIRWEKRTCPGCAWQDAGLVTPAPGMDAAKAVLVTAAATNSQPEPVPSSSTLTIAAASASADYRAVASSSSGTVESSVARLTVKLDPG